MTVYALDPIRDTKHLGARSAGELKAWLAWLELGGYAPASLDGYERTCAALLVKHPSKELGQFTDDDIAAFLMGFPAKSRRIRKAHVSSWFKWAYRTRRISANPVDMLPTIKRHPQPAIDVFTEAEQLILEALPSPDGHLMMLLFETGLRRAEACNMRFGRINLNDAIVTVSEGAKGSRDRVVPMLPRLQQAIANLALLEGLTRDDYLWYDKPGGGFAKKVRRNKPIAGTSFGRWWRRCIDEAGLEYRKPHTARHTFATRWRARGLDVDDIQILLGHASVSTTSDLYVHTGIDRVAVKMFALAGEQV